MSMHKSGRNDTITPGASCDLKLADYINRKSKHDALMNSKPKMTFEQWRDKKGFPVTSTQEPLWRECWNTAQENM